MAVEEYHKNWLELRTVLLVSIDSTLLTPTQCGLEHKPLHCFYKIVYAGYEPDLKAAVHGSLFKRIRRAFEAPG